MLISSRVENEPTYVMGRGEKGQLCDPGSELLLGERAKEGREYPPVAPVAYQVIPEPGIGQFREFEPRRVRTRINLLGHFLCTN